MSERKGMGGAAGAIIALAFLAAVLLTAAAPASPKERASSEQRVEESACIECWLPFF